MKGLVLKDLLVLKKGFKSYLAFLLLYAVISLLSPSSNLFATLLVVIVMLMPINCFSWDNYTNWDTYAMALPVRRRTVVAARYVLVLLIALGCALLIFALSLLSGLIHSGVDWSALLRSSGVCIAGALLSNGLTLPLLYKYGPERARILMMVAIILIFVVIYGLEDVLETIPLPPVSPVGVGVFAALLLAAALAVSYLISCRIYEAKEA